MGSPVVRNFMKQQGFGEESPGACDLHFRGLLFQPWIVFPLVVLGILTGSGVFLMALGLLLLWNTALPALNPFEVLYNVFVAQTRGQAPLPPAPMPRRFAQGMASAFLLGAGGALLVGTPVVAWVLEGFLVAAFSALLFGRFCLGAYIYHLLAGRVRFANATLPWGRSE